MLRSLYIATNSMDVQQAKLNTVSNNLANIDTTGYKKNDVEIGNFPEALKLALEAKGPAGKREIIGEANLGTMITKEVVITSQGPLMETGSNTDFGLQGRGFFAVEDPDGEVLYTRDGSFYIDAEGNLLNGDGYPVLGEGGAITIEDPQHFLIKEDGTIVVGEGEDADEVDKLQITEFEDTSLLKKVDGNNYFMDPLGIGEPATETRVSQGSLEKSNVDLVKEVADMIATARIYESSHKLIQVTDELLDKSINQVGRVK
ncbi:flagellar hook-basal body protein [Desulforamulus ruminis]|uniref:Flagellar hook-basal body protein n=1 Tax=Desulforamulus ruminis (strain ATCC 23193 / DSM 2154 / NCIMB 8452 / DL) TaxID=696281 RepID=F6DNT8_DESRL|nr:flagellar hook-basal body protein [Desulforamulus ruminis]AEG59533.1 flagellar hook-basal body protein [Desulforamulus ruminis DSM 2154]